MQKKRLNIILILAVLGLWGSVIYKSLNRFFPSERNGFVNVNQSQSLDFKKIRKDTFLLKKLNRDPFLDKALAEVPKIVVNRNTKPVIINKTPNNRPIIKVKEIIWPQVFYYGYIKSQQKTDELILVKIDNKLLKVRKNENIEGLNIKRVYKDSIEVVFNKEKKFIYKSNK